MTVPCATCRAGNPESARFCQACGAPVAAAAHSVTHTVAGVIGLPPARAISSGSIAAGGFTPGTILATRYRIIGLLGRGGMGEVYRADDLTLGQAVALKFLPPGLAGDPVRRERLYAEVRIARQISHPNVCRVYDVAEVDGRQFLSMEYVDGEDLASLLTRIGHLPAAKAIEIARQLCAGIAAAHDKGVLHRDLKPANVMLDGRGRVRITDFGLAVAAEDAHEEGVVSGTPAYMAPEQLAGERASVRSDIYALGLVLYELHTGKRAFEAATIAELRRQKEHGTLRAASELTRDVDPVVDRVIQRCLETDPRLRPASALQVAAALPGGDPLAAALAAGETPSPEMVAASGSTEGLRPPMAWSLVLATIVAAAIALVAAEQTIPFRRMDMNRSPAFIAERARDILREIGYSRPAGDSAFGIFANFDYWEYQQARGLTRNVDLVPARTMLVWYRDTPELFWRFAFIGKAAHNSVSPGDPPMGTPGEVRFTFDGAGTLSEFTAVPPPLVPAPGAVAEPDWSPLFRHAGLTASDWVRSTPQWIPPFHADAMVAWERASPADDGEAIRIEAASERGVPTFFSVRYPWTPPPRVTRGVSGSQRIADVTGVVILLVLLFGSALFARRNLRLGRGDRQGAWRLMTTAAVLLTVTWLLSEEHVPALWELYLFLMYVGWTLFVCALLGVMYLAFEPYVRRKSPAVLISWSRMLGGSFRDPLVGRDILIGCATGAAIVLMRLGTQALPEWTGSGSAHALLPWPTPWIGVTQYVAFQATWALVSLFFALGTLFLYVLMQIVLRHRLAAAVATVLLLSAGDLAVAPTWAVAVSVLALYTLLTAVLLRVGFVALVISSIAAALIREGPGLVPLSAWHSSLGLTSLVLLALLVGYGFHTSLGGRPAFGRLSIDQ
jgi:serine/threonine-protein kinase